MKILLTFTCFWQIICRRLVSTTHLDSRYTILLHIENVFFQICACNAFPKTRYYIAGKFCYAKNRCHFSKICLFEQTLIHTFVLLSKKKRKLAVEGWKTFPLETQKSYRLGFFSNISWIELNYVKFFSSAMFINVAKWLFAEHSSN